MKNLIIYALMICLFEVSANVIDNEDEVIVTLNEDEVNDGGNETELYDIEGEVSPPEYLSAAEEEHWIKTTSVVVQNEEYVGLLDEDNKFVIPNVPPGSYIVEVLSPLYEYEPVRVDINSRGKQRVRKLSYIQSTQVVTLPYPITFKPLGRAEYFTDREEWRILELLMNPMVLMMILPLLCVMILPRLVNEPDAKKDMEQLEPMTKYDMPEVSELITSFFSDKKNKKPANTTRSLKGKRRSSNSDGVPYSTSIKS